jgi:hypothetical protein
MISSPTAQGGTVDNNHNNPTITYTPDEDEGVACFNCGIVCDGADAVTDDFIALCGSVYGNGCADEPGAFDHEDA